jgi:diketogulonate reductase-like aldo/keto reductase
MADPLAIPEVIYGTAFKFDNTARLVEQALKAGFRGIDTASNKNAYSETLVGEGVAAAIASSDVSRDELYVWLSAFISDIRGQ